MIHRFGMLLATAVLAATTAFVTALPNAAIAMGSTDSTAPAESPPQTSAPADLVLRYQAFLAGAPVGEATVEVSLREGTYSIRGDARSNGWLKRFSNWRNRFSARGRIEGPELAPAEFTYTEQDADKHRHVVVRDGFLQVTKNGRQRPRRPSPAGADVVSALFVHPRCDQEQVLHTGRHVYRLNRVASSASGCRFSVTDDDDDEFQVELELARHGGLPVPARVTVRGWATGSIRLVEAVTVDGSSHTEETPPLQLGE